MKTFKEFLVEATKAKWKKAGPMDTAKNLWVVVIEMPETDFSKMTQYRQYFSDIASKSKRDIELGLYEGKKDKIVIFYDPNSSDDKMKKEPSRNDIIGVGQQLIDLHRKKVGPVKSPVITHTIHKPKYV